MAPAATDSPMEPTVRVMFSSSSEPFIDPQQRHADDGCRIGGRDGHARAQAQISVGSTQNDGQNQSQQHGTDV